jgi:hypothetical protein
MRVALALRDIATVYRLATAAGIPGCPVAYYPDEGRSSAVASHGQRDHGS